jgi:hypothetical protein
MGEATRGRYDRTHYQEERMKTISKHKLRIGVVTGGLMLVILLIAIWSSKSKGTTTPPPRPPEVAVVDVEQKVRPDAVVNPRPFATPSASAVLYEGKAGVRNPD